MDKIGIYPGSFDPVTNGHLDIIKRASKILDKVYVVVSLNINKRGLFSFEERVQMLQEVTQNINNIVIDHYDGLIVDYAKSKNASVIVRGIRAISDFESEFKLFSFNNDLNCDIETVILLAKSSHLFLASSDIKEIAKFNGDISKFVPRIVVDRIKTKFHYQ